MNFRLAEIGIILLVTYFTLALGDLIVAIFGAIFGLRFGLMFWAIYFDPRTALVLLLLAVVGLILYISDRKKFLNRIRSSKIAPVSLVVLSLILMIEGVFVGIATFTHFWYLHTKIPGGYSLTWEDSVYFTLAPVLIVFKVVSSIPLLVDGIQLTQNKSSFPPLKQETDTELQKKYSRNLFTKYVMQYPHNPEGVLEWHIHKKMKEGKTRQQAIRELEK